MAHKVALGIDIGGSGMKAAPVDVIKGEMLTERHRIATPQPATPEAMADVVRQLVEHFAWSGPVGMAFPSIVRRGVAGSAANIDRTWIGIDIDATFTKASGCDVHVINDADAAGLAEIRFGAGRGHDGVVLMLTFGTGIGSGLFIDGNLVPNTELGHVELDGHVAESRAAAVVRDREDLSWAEWAGRVDHYLDHVVRLFSPDLVIVGGGVSKKSDKWLPHITLDAPIVPAEMHNSAGIVGAALIAP
jgi:polyphosphate glucokinase